jgi:hypothetical protein
MRRLCLLRLHTLPNFLPPPLPRSQLPQQLNLQKRLQHTRPPVLAHSRPMSRQVSQVLCPLGSQVVVLQRHLPIFRHLNLLLSHHPVQPHNPHVNRRHNLQDILLVSPVENQADSHRARPRVYPPLCQRQSLVDNPHPCLPLTHQVNLLLSPLVNPVGNLVGCRPVSHQCSQVVSRQVPPLRVFMNTICSTWTYSKIYRLKSMRRSLTSSMVNLT